jgi:hypothetical protein
MVVGKIFGAVGISLLVLASGVNARTAPEAGPPPAIERLLACEGQKDAAQRLQCFDRETAAVRQSLAKRDLVVVDRARASQARRGLFGFSVPSFGGLFGGDDKDAIRQIESAVARASRNAEGGWTVRLADGSTWTQTDDNPIALEPRSGDKVVVRRAALGSFTMSVSRQPGVKVRRIG